MSDSDVEFLVCNLCGSPNRTIVIDGRFGQIAKCDRCGLMFRLTTTAAHPVEHAGGVDRLAKQFEIKQKVQLVDYQKCFSVIERYLPSATRDLVEIGSFTGHFLRLAREKGWNVRGVEPDENAARLSVDGTGLDVSISDLRGAGLQPGSFDAVVMFHVIEHFRDPFAELEEIHRVLRRGGILVAETPRFDTIWFRLLKERERSVIPDHLFYFTRSTLAKIVTRAGFSVVQLDTVGRTLALDRLITNVAKVVDWRALSRLLAYASDRLQLNRITLHVNTHDMMRIYAQRN